MIEHIFSLFFFGVEGGFGEETGVFVGFHSKLVLIAVVPDFLHVVPALDDSVFDGVFKFEDTSLGVGFRTDIDIFIFGSHHDAFGLGGSHDCGEGGSGIVFSRQSGLAHS